MKKILLIVVTLIVVASSAFYGGMKYAQNKTLIRSFGQGNQQRFQGPGANASSSRSGASMTNGDIIAKDDKSLTIKLRDGGSKIIFLSGSTQIMKSVDGSISDLAVGQNVMINGSANADGSLTAQAVQLRPALPASASSTPQR